VQFEWQLQAACGYAELGMARESLAELDAIPRCCIFGSII